MDWNRLPNALSNAFHDFYLSLEWPSSIALRRVGRPVPLFRCRPHNTSEQPIVLQSQNSRDSLTVVDDA